jgi:hypothetical protein
MAFPNSLFDAPRRLILKESAPISLLLIYGFIPGKSMLRKGKRPRSTTQGIRIQAGDQQVRR